MKFIQKFKPEEKIVMDGDDISNGEGEPAGSKSPPLVPDDPIMPETSWRKNTSRKFLKKVDKTNKITSKFKIFVTIS